MLIKCENCSVIYKVPDERLALEHPHFFKCSACGSVFEVPLDNEVEEQTESSTDNELIENTDFVETTEVPPVEQTDAVPMPLSDIFNPAESDIDDTPEQADINLFEPLEETTEEFSPVTSELPQNKHFWSFWGSLTVAFVAASLLFYVGRYFFIRKVPATEKVYQSVGIKTDVLGEGLAFQDTLFDIQKNSQNYELIIRSQIVNTTDETKKIPNVVVHVFDEKDNVIQTGHIYLSDRVIEAGQFRPIETHLKELLEGAKRVEITFERDAHW